MRKPAGEPFLCIPPGMAPLHPAQVQWGNGPMPKGMPVSLLGFNKNPGPYSGWAHYWGVKAFWWTLQMVTAEDGLEQGDQRQIKDSGWEGSVSQKVNLQSNP